MNNISTMAQITGYILGPKAVASLFCYIYYVFKGFYAIY